MLATICVYSLLQHCSHWLLEETHFVVLEIVVSNCDEYLLERRKFVVNKRVAIAMNNLDTMRVNAFADLRVNAVIWSIVPLARKHQ